MLVEPWGTVTYGRPFARISGRTSTWIEIFELLAGAQLFMSESDGNDIGTSSEHSIIISNVAAMRPHFRKLSHFETQGQCLNR